MKTKIKKTTISPSPMHGEDDVQQQSLSVEEHPSIEHPHGKSDDNKERAPREHPHEIQTTVAVLKESGN